MNSRLIRGILKLIIRLISHGNPELNQRIWLKMCRDYIPAILSPKDNEIVHSLRKRRGLSVDPGLRKIFFDEYNMPEGKVDQLFGVEKSTKATEYDLGVGGLGDLEEFNGTIGYDDFDQQYRVSYTHREWCKGIKIERRLIDDDQYAVVNKLPAQLALVAKRTREKHGATVFNNAFNTSVFTGGDSLALCSTAHTYVGTATTVGNYGTSALSATAVEATRLLGRQFTDETDNLMVANLDTILVPPNLEETAWEIVNSNGKLGTADNDLNFSKGKYKIVVWDYENSPYTEVQ